MKIGVVVLTMGTRPEELRLGLHSVLDQQGVEVDVVCVGNGWQPVDLPPGVRALALPENVGIPAGRNAGVPQVAGDLVFFLDDDARIRDPGTLAELAGRFVEHPRLGLVQPRVVDPHGRPAPGRWVPRLRAGDHGRPGPATSLWEGAVMVRRSVLEEVGGWPEPFFYAHEGIELCWRTWDTGHVAWYAGDVEVLHPVIDPRRHAEFWRLNARNRVWLARRNLPWLLRPVYAGTWAVLTLLRSRDTASWRAWRGGFVEGWRTDPGERRVMRWSTVVALTRAGRPPVI
ncbi:MAG TPA: glycosyltransferase [Mycobacteriales bacterium]|nr:glycosyltransferase [Mycobacteriales bacterium]